jgi:hypothetical protein
MGKMKFTDWLIKAYSWRNGTARKKKIIGKAIKSTHYPK